MAKNKLSISKKYISILIPYFLMIIFLSVLYSFLYKILMPRINAFGCFDDCFNYVGGYFILKGKTLYSEIFFNHQPFMAYISYVIQSFKHPQSIYELLLVHRKFLLLFSFAMNFILLMRFRWPALGFILFYEFTKFYVFGDRFLAESFIVYPLVYLGGLVFYKMKKIILRNFDYILSALLAWFVIFMREPYIPLTLFLFGIIVIGKSFSKIKKISVFLFIFLSLFTLFQLPLKDYFFNIITVSNQTIIGPEFNSVILFPKLLKIFFYPIYLLLTSRWTIFQQILALTDVIFIFLLIFYWIRIRSKTLVLIIIAILGLANLRVINPGAIFYEAFHMIQWYGLFIFFVFLMIDYLVKKQKMTATFLYGLLILIFAYFLLPSASYIYDKIDPQYELITNYGKELQVGEVVRKLSNPSDTLFLDGFDDLIYWQSNRISPYKYSWYTSSMHVFPIYQNERLRMFSVNPPDFYYGSCLSKKELTKPVITPGGSKDRYIRLYNYNNPSCLFVNEKKINNINEKQWKDAEEFGYTLKPLR